MSEPVLPLGPQAAYQVDDFLQRVRSIHQFLRTLLGFVHDLEPTRGPGSLNPHHLGGLGQCRSRRKAEEGCRETGFKPAEPMERPGIEAEMASYTIAG
jgi:hypothetical protein